MTLDEMLRETLQFADFTTYSKIQQSNLRLESLIEEQYPGFKTFGLRVEEDMLLYWAPGADCAALYSAEEFVQMYNKSTNLNRLKVDLNG